MITVTSRDGGHKATVNVTVTTFTDNPPVITANNVAIALGSEFNPLDYAIISDVEDQDLALTSEHVIANDVNPTLAGVYHVTYKVTDSAGNEAEKTITVTVMQDPEEVTLTSEQGIKIIGLFTDTDSVEVKDLTADHEDFDRQEIVKVWQLKMGSSSRSRGLTQYEVRIPFTEKKDGIHLYRYHISYQPISDFKFEGDELVFNTTVLDGVYVITRSQPDPAPNTPSDSSDEVNSANPAVPAAPEKPKSTGSFWSSLFGNKKQTEEESMPVEEAESPAQNESKPEAPAPTAQPEKTPEVKPEEKSASSPWMLVGGTVVIVAAGAALWMLKKRK